MYVCMYVYMYTCIHVYMYMYAYICTARRCIFVYVHFSKRDENDATWLGISIIIQTIVIFAR